MKKGSVSQDGGGGQVIVRMERESSGTTPKTKYLIRVCPNTAEQTGGGDVTEQQYNIGTRHTADLVDLVREFTPNELIEKAPSLKSNLKGSDKNLNGVAKRKQVAKKVTISEPEKVSDQGQNRNKNKPSAQNIKDARPSTANKICEVVNKKHETKKDPSIIRVDDNESFEIYGHGSNESVQQKQYFSANHIQYINEIQKTGQNQNIVPNRQVSYDCLEDLIKKMTNTHWTMIDNTYRKLKSEKYITYKALSELINSIINDVFSKDLSSIFLQGIDTNKRIAITKLAKILLNLYQEAYEQHINEKGMSQKINYHNKLKPEPFKNGNAARRKTPNPNNVYYRGPRKSSRCEACHANVNSSINKIVPKKCGTQKSSVVKRKTVPIIREQSEKPSKDSIWTSNAEKEVIDVKARGESAQIGRKVSREGTDKGAEEAKVQKVSASGVGDAGEVNTAGLEDPVPADASSMKQQQVLEALERSLLRLFQSPDEVGLDEVIRSTMSAKEMETEAFQTTMDLLWLNEKVEKRRLEEEMAPDPSLVDYFTEEEVSRQDINPSPNRWVPQECLQHMSYVRIGISVMFGIAAAYFSREEPISNETITMKATLKKYLKCFLQGALRLVDGS